MKHKILLAAVDVAIEKGYQQIVVGDVMARVGHSEKLAYYYYKNVNVLKDAVINHAMQNEVLPIVAQFIANNPDTKICYSLRVKAANHIQGD